MPDSTPIRLHRRDFQRALASVGLSCLAGVLGCRHTAKNSLVELPARHSIQADQLVVLSDFRLKYDHPLIKDLTSLRQDIAENLDLTLDGQPVVVYLFTNDDLYQQYLQRVYPSLPPRRAYFIGTREELAVYTYWGDRIQEDLRHEFTHGLLHSSLKSVPLWLDEGLAEYFEVITLQSPPVNVASVRQLAVSMRRGWKPGLERLESLKDVSQMTQGDYQESWAWVHFMLHQSPETRTALLGYLADLRKSSDAGLLQKRLREVVPALDQHFLAYVDQLQDTTASLVRS